MGRDFRKPGYRRGKYSHRTRMIAKLVNIEIAKYHHPGGSDDDEETDSGREAVGLAFRLVGMPRSKFWSLTYLTVDELDAAKRVIDSAFDAARPICIQRDKEAVDAYENGDDSDPRIYRAAPLVVDRESGERPHGALLSKRSAAVSGSGGTDGDSDGDLRGEGPAVAQPQPSGVGGQDHPAP